MEKKTECFSKYLCADHLETRIDLLDCFPLDMCSGEQWDEIRDS